MPKRKRHSGEFKAKIVLEALRGDPSVTRLAAIHDINPSLIHKWIKEAKVGLSRVFEEKVAPINLSQEHKIKLLHEKIGQLTVERDYLAQICGRKTAKQGLSAATSLTG